MHWPRLNTDQFNEVIGDIGRVMDDDSTTAQDDTNSSLDNLPTELLVKIFSYLPICDKMKMQYVSPRFKHIMEVPSLWKDFVWPHYEPLQVCSVSKILKAQGEHVRRIYSPAHVTLKNILKMVQCCTKVTHLSLPRNLSLDHLEEIVHAMKHLQQLDMFVNEKHMESRILATAAGMKKLILRYEDSMNRSLWLYITNSFGNLLEGIRQQGKNLPSLINVYIPCMYHMFENQLLQFWSTWSFKLPSFEVGLYVTRRTVPINLYPSIPHMKFQFGPAATPPLIKLSDHGILGLQYDIFHFTDYDHYGEVRHSMTAQYYRLDVVKKHFNRTSNLYSVSNIDFCGMGTHDIYPGHLEQLAIACPNLERINLKYAIHCLQSLKGLRAIVDKCKNLQGINLAGMHISFVEGNLLLWELLSSVKKLTHLAINLSMLTHHGNCADQQKLIGLLKSCGNLKALEITDQHDTVDSKDLLFSHFPSLVYVKLGTEDSGPLECTITNCHQLKYLHYYARNLSIRRISFPSSNSGHLQQLYMENIDLSAASAHVLSAHGGLEQIILYDVRITTSAITTLISNSPNLILLHIFDTRLNLEDYKNTMSRLNLEDYKNTMSNTFSNHKLFTVGDFFIDTNIHYL